MSETEWWGISFGTFGGFGVMMAELHALRKVRPKLRDFTKAFFYYAVSLGMAIVGGVLVLAHMKSGNPSMSALLQVNIGASAPLAFAALSKYLPQLKPGKSN